MCLVPVPAQGVELDMDEVECIAANLIFRKYVKGYLSHKAKVMVVAKVRSVPPCILFALCAYTFAVLLPHCEESVCAMPVQTDPFPPLDTASLAD